jgi:hypothetical protein
MERNDFHFKMFCKAQKSKTLMVSASHLQLWQSNCSRWTWYSTRLSLLPAIGLKEGDQ